MNERNYCIAGHYFRIMFADDMKEDIEALTSYLPFLVDKSERNYLFTVSVCGEELLPHEGKGKEIGQFDCGGNNFGVYSESAGQYYIEISDVHNRLCAVLVAGNYFADCQLYVCNVSPESRLFGINNALMVIYAFSSCDKSTLLMHSSVIGYQGKGYLFLGVSGTGKSTHTSLWLKHIEGAELMNDDNPVIRITDDGVVRVYGSPWSGKTPCYRNVEAPVGALVQLQQKPENTIRRQNVVECFATMLISVSTMKWDTVIYRNICDTISEVIRKVPIYCLGCLPDKEAAELSCMTITENKNQ